MSERFHNPYHFVPLSGVHGPGRVAREAKDWPAHLTHDRYAIESTSDGANQPVFSGRIVCRAAVEDLLAVGARQDAPDSEPRRVALFQINGQWALPGSSLRGMIAAIAETASNSTLRVLENKDVLWSEGKDKPTHNLGKVHALFERVCVDLVPLAREDRRKQLTVAEQLFGLVEEGSPGHNETQTTLLAFATRVRFSNALPYGDVEVVPADRVTAVLGSPGFQRPDRVFGNGAKEPRQGGGPARPVVPRGRKIYLHREGGVSREDWVRGIDRRQSEQQTQVRPIISGNFWFHVDFDNLTQLELGLLCYALRPNRGFRHKLGLGKPLGLGKLRVDRVALLLVDRARRYRSLKAPRYSRAWWSDAVQGDEWPDEYFEIVQDVDYDDDIGPATLASSYRMRVIEKFPDMGSVLNALESFGNPGNVKHRVRYAGKREHDDPVKASNEVPSFEGSERRGPDAKGDRRQEYRPGTQGPATESRRRR